MWPYAGPPPGPPPGQAVAGGTSGGSVAVGATTATAATAPPPQGAATANGASGGGNPMEAQAKQLSQTDHPNGGSLASQASTSVNIAVLDAKDFPAEVAPTSELHTEFVMADGAVLFKCPNLLKASGIDLMNCPLTLILKLQVKKKMATQSLVLWHLVLPLAAISKNLVNPPFEWETWIGLFPNTQPLEQHPPETMFTQAVHLISRPDFPKLRLRFSYHNLQLQEQLSAQQRQREEESRRRVEETQKFGRAEFEEIQRMAMKGAPASQVSSGMRPKDVPRPAVASSPPVSQQPDAASRPPVSPRGGSECPQQVAVPVSRSSEDRLWEALVSSLRFMDAVRGWVDVQQAQRKAHGGGMPDAAAPPRPLDPSEVLSSANPAALVDSHGQHLRYCLQELPSGAGGGGSQVAAATKDAEVEAMLVEALQVATMGMLDPREKSTTLSASTGDRLTNVRRRFPRLWEALTEVSALAHEHNTLLEHQRRS